MKVETDFFSRRSHGSLLKVVDIRQHAARSCANRISNPSSSVRE